MKCFSKVMIKPVSLLLIFSMVLSIISSCPVYAFAEKEPIDDVVEHQATQPMEELTASIDIEQEAEQTENAEEIPTEKKDTISALKIEELSSKDVDTTVKFNVEEAYADFMALENDEAKNAYLSNLTPEEYSVLESYAKGKENEKPLIIPETVVFTDAGPFLPPVNIAPKAKAHSTLKSSVDNDGIETSKTVQCNGDGTYTLKLESYVTGDIKTITKTTPVDIVLVLDQSGSMSYNFNGEHTNQNSQRRQYAMKQAVTSFIAEVSKTYKAESDHRISIVTFGSEAYTLSDWQYVNESGKIRLQRKVNNLPNRPSGATNIGAGMKVAENLMGSAYNYTGINNERQKVVIAFTDGSPTTTNKFDVEVANTAIRSAKNLKDTGVTIYSVGIFGGANPNQMYGDKGFKQNSNGSVGSVWYDEINRMTGENGVIDIPACNRFLNYVSSNFNGAMETGLKNYEKNNFFYDYLGWEITNNFDRNENGYYLTADDSESLKNIFEKISSNIGGASIELGQETVLKDVISHDFKLPEGADVNSIKVFTCDYNSNGTWGNPVEEPKAKISISKLNGQDVIDVTGFDYSKNFCSEIGRQEDNPSQPGDFYGRKIQVLIPIEPINNFIGGNDILTNDNGSGIYDKENNIIENFISPKVNVPIKTYTPIARDVNVFYGDDFSLLEILKGVGNNSIFDYKIDDIVYDIDGKNNEFVDITYKISTVNTDGTTNLVSSVTIPHGKTDAVFDYIDETVIKNIKKDFDYKIELIVVPSTSGEGSVGEINDSIGSKAESKIASVNVFTPIVQFNDLYAYLGNDIPTNEQIGKAYISEKTVWKHENTLSTNVQMSGNEPKLYFEYATNKNGKINNLDDIQVNVTTKSNNMVVGTENNKFNIIIFSPEITFKDSEIKLGEVADYNDNYVGIKWKYNNYVVANSKVDNSEIIDSFGSLTGKKIIGRAPKLTYSYDPVAAAFRNETPVKVKSIKIFGIDITEFTTFIREKCPICGAENGIVNGNEPNFVVHIKCADLTITKVVSDINTLDPNQTFIFEVKGKKGSLTSDICITVAIKGNGSVKIKHLPVGEYTITEDENWSWRYDAVQSKQTVNTETTQEVVFENICTNDKWLDSNAYSDNVFADVCNK